VLFHVT